MKKIFISIIMVLFINLFASISFDKGACFYENNKKMNYKNNYLVCTDYVSNNDYKNIMPLYNLDDEIKFVYYELANGGYSIVCNETGEILESSSNGKIEFLSDKNYYFGPFNLFSKLDNECKNIYTLKTEDLTSEKYIDLANKVDDLFNIEASSFKRDCRKDSFIHFSELNPEYNGNDVINGNSFDINYANLITNYKYFMSNPTIGLNDGTPNCYGETGLCGPIAAQLLLSYLNYYVDRRIIADCYLNGYDNINNCVNNQSYNPNYCDNPNDMSSIVIGSASDLDSVYSFINRLCYMMIDNNSGTSHLSLENGLSSYLNSDYGNSFTLNHYSTSNYDYIFTNAKNYINNDKPFILGLNNHQIYSTHYVVAYGYSEYYLSDYDYMYNGYVIHDGYYNNLPETDKWINSKFCDYYLEIDINHSHNYDSRVQSPNSTSYEYRCTVCNHRTSYVIDYNYDNYAKRMVEKNVVLNGKTNRICEYFIKTNSTTNRIITTIGQKDVKIRIRTSDGTLVANNDDGGYGLNPMLNISLTSNNWYKIQIVLNEYISNAYSQNQIIVLMLIFNSDRSRTNEFSGFRQYLGTTTAYLERKESLVFRFAPSSIGDYSFITDYSDNNIVDTYIYIYNMSNYMDKACNDDGGGNLQAAITRHLTYGTEYLIIITAYNPNSQNGVVSLLVNNSRAELPSTIISNRIMRQSTNVSSNSGLYLDKYGNNSYKVTDSSLTNSSQPKIILDLADLGINLPTLQYSTYKTVIVCIQLSFY